LFLAQIALASLTNACAEALTVLLLDFVKILANVGMAKAARIPRMVRTTINSKSVNPLNLKNLFILII